MIPQKLVRVQVLVCLVILTQVISSSVAASSSKSKSSKSTKSKSSSSQRQRSGHQYAPTLLLRPSKPDPHFEILDEQRGINYHSRLREGRDGSTERKPTKLKEATTSSLQRRSSSAITNSASSYSKKGKKEKARPKASSSSSSIESTFSKKSIEVVERTPPKFSGSQLISGEAGPLTHYSRRTELVERDGWKILTGPSVSPDETDLHANENNAGNRRTFTSLTDDGASKHRTITKLRPMKKGKSIAGSSSSSSRYYDMTNEISPIKKMLTEAERDFPASNRKAASRRTMQVSIPKQTLKHKYATITKRAPSKTAVTKNEAISETTEKKARNKVKQNTGSKLLRPSKQIKSSLETRYASIENDINRMSPVMTLDTKKLVIEPIGSSAQPATLSTAPSMSMEVFSGEQEPTGPSLSMFSSLESRFDPIPLPIGDTTEVVDGNHGGHDNYFQTKTALNSAEYPLISVAASMNYPGSKRHKEQGGIITASSFANQHHHVDESEHRFLDFSPSHLAEVQEPALKNPFLEETENFQHFSPMSPHVEFVGAGTAGSKIPAPSSLHGPVGASRLPLHNGRLNSKLPPSRNRFPVELPPSPDFHFHGSVVPSENSFVTAGRYPHFSVGSRQPPPGLQDSLPRPPEPVSSNIYPVLHGPPPFAPHGHHRIPSHRPLPPPPPPPYHHSHRHPPPPMALGSMRRPQFAPMDLGSGRKAAAPPGDFVFEIGSLPPAHNPPPPPGVDPDHPAVQHALRNPHTILNDGIYIEPTDSSSNVHETTKKYLHNLHYQVHQNTLIPLDKRLVYLSMIFSWMFWITTFYTYYRWSVTGNKAKQIVLNVPKDGDTPQVTTRSLDTSSPWNFTKVLEYIEIAQKTYEGFDWQDLECQKRTLCELVQKQNEPWGETGRKLANSYVYHMMDALDGVPIPTMIQTYLRQYKEAISQGKNSSKDCGQVYSKCKFSIKEVLNKAAAKKKA